MGKQENLIDYTKARKIWQFLSPDRKSYLLEAYDDIDDFWILFYNGEWKPNKTYLNQVANTNFDDLKPKYKQLVNGWVYYEYEQLSSQEDWKEFFNN